MKRNTAEFLRILNERNAAIAAREVAEREARVDQVRLQRDEERRVKWGTLRAREHQGKRPISARSIYRIDLS